MLLYGPPKSGKSLLSAAFIGELMQKDPEAIVVHFDTEFRDNLDTWNEAFGIDPERFISRQTNNPEEIFDYIANDLNAMIQEGAPIKMIVIDSLAMIYYPKESRKESTTDFVIGDASAYLPGAMKKILPVVRKNKIALILCQHVRDQMDPMLQRVQRYNIPGGRGLKHSVEAWMLVEKINAKDSKVFDTERKDGAGNAIQSGHAIRVRMEENSLGPQNRAAEVFLDYQKGIVDQHVQVADLAINMGIVERPNNMSYAFDGKKWVGRDSFLEALKQDKNLQTKLVEKIKENDIS
jgi:RecA/RadA recombinase